MKSQKKPLSLSRSCISDELAPDNFNIPYVLAKISFYRVVFFFACFVLTSTIVSRILCQLHQFRINNLIGFLEYSYEISSLFTISGSEECICCTSMWASSSSSYSVYIVLRWVWVIKVDHKFDVFYIYIRENW